MAFSQMQFENDGDGRRKKKKKKGFSFPPAPPQFAPLFPFKPHIQEQGGRDRNAFLHKNFLPGGFSLWYPKFRLGIQSL